MTAIVCSCMMGSASLSLMPAILTSGQMTISPQSLGNRSVSTSVYVRFFTLGDKDASACSFAN